MSDHKKRKVDDEKTQDQEDKPKMVLIVVNHIDDDPEYYLVDALARELDVKKALEMGGEAFINLSNHEDEETLFFAKHIYPIQESVEKVDFDEVLSEPVTIHAILPFNLKSSYENLEYL